jgi:hypothetical protein
MKHGMYVPLNFKKATVNAKGITRGEEGAKRGWVGARKCKGQVRWGKIVKCILRMDRSACYEHREQNQHQ